MIVGAAAAGRRWLVPEVVQSSAMDCGPASLKCLLDGFGIRVSYGRLREACQTDVDGTSIDTLEEVALQLGLRAEQVIVPPDHVLVPEASSLPAIAVVTLANGNTHFVVVWNRAGPLVQVMDPGTGRRWPTAERFTQELYTHAMPVPAEGWREWAGSEEFLAPLRGRMRRVGVGAREAERLIGLGCDDPGYATLAVVDAATRMVEGLIQARALRRGSEGERFLKVCFSRSEEHGGTIVADLIPAAYWTVTPAEAVDGEEQVNLSGAVLVRILGRRSGRLASGSDAPRTAAAPEAGAPGEAPHDDELDDEADDEADDEEPPPLSPELVAALAEPPSRPGRELWQMLRADGLFSPLAVLGALLLSSAAVTFEALLFRGLLDLGGELGLTEQRAGALGLLLVFLVGLALLELPITSVILRAGRRLETRLRAAFLGKIPRLGDRYFHSRLTSDMAERSHSVHHIRGVTNLGEDLLRGVFALLLTVAGIAWLDPASAPSALAVAVISVAAPLLVQPLLTERDLRVRTHTGALSRFYMDGLLGLTPIRTHGAERSVRREHESLLTEWARSSLSLLRASVVVQGILALAGLGTAVWLLFGYLARQEGVEGVLLLVYWALQLPAHGATVAQAARQYPVVRNVTLRLMEPLSAPEETPPGEGAGRAAEGEPPPAEGVAVELAGITVRAGGHTIIDEVELSLAPGEQVAVVGRSGAGKSSLVGVLLGWHVPSSGQVRVDGRPLDGAALEHLRRQTAWVDPSVQLWNRPFLDNLRYGLPDQGNRPLAEVVRQANLRPVLETLPHGLQTSLGESGALVSGGEGQRVRLGRAMMRGTARLVILDEPFRGLDREQRRALLSRCRAWWPGATLICITHDVGETRAFPRVVLMEGARVVEQGAPEELAAAEGSLYRQMLRREKSVRSELWSGAGWRPLELAAGRLTAGGAGEGEEGQ